MSAERLSERVEVAGLFAALADAICDEEAVAAVVSVEIAEGKIDAGAGDADTLSIVVTGSLGSDSTSIVGYGKGRRRLPALG